MNNFELFGLTAGTEAGGGASAYSGIILLIVMFAAFYFLIIRPQKKKDKEIKQMRDSVAVGDEIVTIGGIHGKVAKVSDDTIVLELPHGKQRITFAKWAVGTVEKKSKEAKAQEIIEEAAEDKATEDNKTEEQ